MSIVARKRLAWSYSPTMLRHSSGSRIREVRAHPYASTSSVAAGQSIRATRAAMVVTVSCIPREHARTPEGCRRAAPSKRGGLRIGALPAGDRRGSDTATPYGGAHVALASHRRPLVAGRIEPGARGQGRRHSARGREADFRICGAGAGDGLRTRYLNLGNKAFRDRIHASRMALR